MMFPLLQTWEMIRYQGSSSAPSSDTTQKLQYCVERMQTPQCRVHCLLDSQGKKVRHSDESHEEYNIDKLDHSLKSQIKFEIILMNKI